MRSLLLVLVLNTVLSGQESKPVFQSYTPADGLGGESINELLIDRYGYLWSAAYSGLHRFDGYEFVDYPADITDSCALSHPIATSLLEDEAGNLWIGTRGGLNLLDRATNCFQRFFHQPGEAGSLPDNDVVDLAAGPANQLYVLTATALVSLAKGKTQFSRTKTPGLTPQRIIFSGRELLVAGPEGILFTETAAGKLIPFAAGENPNITHLLFRGDTLLVATDTGLFRWLPGGESVERALSPDHPYASASIQQVYLTGEDLWLATRGDGLGRINFPTGKFTQFLVDKTPSGALLDNHTRALTSDDHGNLWIGSYVGLNRLDLSKTAPQTYDQPGENNQSSLILELGTDHAGGVYFYERWGGLYYSSALGSKGELLDFPTNDFLNDLDLNQLYTDRRGITWLLRGHDALYRHDAAKHQFLPPITSTTFKDRRLNGIQQDIHDGEVYWLASSKGLGRLQLPADSIEWFVPDAEVWATSGTVLSVVHAAKDGKIWFSYGNYYNDRLGYFDPENHQFHLLEYVAGDPARIAGGRVKQLAEHPDGSIWAATSQGLIRVDEKNLTARLITRVGNELIGIPESVLADDQGNIWFGAGDQIGRYTPMTDRLSKLTSSSIRQFSNAAAAKLPDGRLLFGGQGGIIAVWSNIPLISGNYPKIVINNLSVNGQTASIPRPDLEELTLQPGERSLTLDFAGLYFNRTRHIHYAYRLNGAPWQGLGTNRSITFTDLRPGNHLLELRSSEGQGNWNPLPRKLSIGVPYFWHETKTARWGFATLALLLLGLLARFLLRRKLERQAHEQLVALDSFKSRLFTDLTHEFRTPLTLILGPARRLRERASQQNDATLGREARRIDRQGRRLLQLINQLLDLRKLEAGQLTVNRQPVALTGFFRALTESFRLEAAGKDITLSFENLGKNTGTSSDFLAIDIAKQESIFHNLLSNALKFTPEGGEVSVRLNRSEKDWTLEVADTGTGIAPEQQPLIFKRFARAHGAEIEGTGIGLSFVSDLTKLLDGTIDLHSEAGAGSTFRLTFPAIPVVGQTEQAPLPVEELPVSEAIEPHHTKDPVDQRAVVLVVDDETDVAAFLRESLRKTYRVLVAKDGQEGLERAFAEIPDLVVSDVMMPRLSGLQLCARLKNDVRTSHLPVLLLTARTAEEHRLEGLDRGADAYLSKPFSEKELHLRLRNLLTLRDRTAARLREEILAAAPTDETVEDSQETTWLVRLKTFIIDNLDNAELAGNDLERHVGMSRSQLQRKLQSVIGLSPRKLVNELRLEVAAARLRDTNDNISEVAYDCGFRDPKYFGRVFRERFGVPPGEWRGIG